MATEVLRFAIIGTGAMGLEHIRNIKLLDNAKVVAIADSNEVARAEAALLLDESATVAVDYRKLDPSTFDAVVLATPNFTHLAVLKHVLEWQKHLLVEKPLCTTVADCYAVQALVDAQVEAVQPPAKPPIFWVGMEYRYMPPVAKLLSIVDSGKMGALKMVSIREHRFPFLLKVDDWNRFSHFTGGTLVEKCCHFWDLMRRIVGAGSVATKVFASGGMDVNHLDERYDASRAQRAQGLDEDGGSSSGAASSAQADTTTQPDIVDNAFVIVEFAGGVRCCLDLCMFAEDRQHEEVSVVGSLGKVHAEAPQCVVTHHTPTQRASGTELRNSRTPPQLGTYEANVEVFHTHVDAKLAEAGFHEGATFFELKAFVDACLVPGGGGTPAVTLEDGLAAVAIGVAAELSLKEGRPVYLTEVLAQSSDNGNGNGEKNGGGAAESKRRKTDN